MEAAYEFVARHAETILSWELLTALVVLYLGAIFALKWWTDRQPKPFNVRLPMAAHNFFLFSLSAVMVGGTAYEAFYVRYPKVGMQELYCSRDTKGVYNGGLYFWSLIFYLSKYYEFLDTVFLLLRKKPLLFLHVWHHCTVAVLSLAFLRYDLTFYFSAVLVNGTIHMFMYWYYYQQSLGNDVWWKKYLTVLQMIQFGYGILSWLPWPYVCGWDERAAAIVGFNVFILSSYFVLFLRFFNKTYDPSQKKASSRRSSSSTPKPRKLD